MTNIMICEDNIKELLEIKTMLKEELPLFYSEYSLKEYTSGQALLKALNSEKIQPNILYLDIMLDDTTGIEIAQAIRLCRKPVQLRYLFFRLSLKTLQQRSSKYLLLNDRAKYYKIPYCEIFYIETEGRKVRIHTSGEEILYPCRLSEIEELLPSSLFIRCHQSYLVQFDAVSKIAQSKAILKNGEEIPISRPYKKQLHNVFIDTFDLQK